MLLFRGETSACVGELDLRAQMATQSDSVRTYEVHVDTLVLRNLHCLCVCVCVCKAENERRW